LVCATGGYVDGHSIAVEVRYADGNLERLKELAKELTQQVNVIVVANSTAAQAVLGAAKNFPIVIAGGSIDPIAEGLADSLANPGHNVTGVSALLRDMGAKYIELAKEVSPRISRVAMLFDKHQPYVFDKTASEVAARQLGISLERSNFSGPRSSQPFLIMPINKGSKPSLCCHHRSPITTQLRLRKWQSMPKWSRSALSSTTP
jgi:putative tryptophan/tyrosine transport system substrate-binding protein